MSSKVALFCACEPSVAAAVKSVFMFTSSKTLLRSQPILKLLQVLHSRPNRLSLQNDGDLNVNEPESVKSDKPLELLVARKQSVRANFKDATDVGELMHKIYYCNGQSEIWHVYSHQSCWETASQVVVWALIGKILEEWWLQNSSTGHLSGSFSMWVLAMNIGDFRLAFTAPILVHTSSITAVTSFNLAYCFHYFRQRLQLACQHDPLFHPLKHIHIQAAIIMWRFINSTQ